MVDQPTGVPVLTASSAAAATQPHARVPAVPRLVWRNTVLLAAVQAFVGAGTQMVPTLGAIMVERLVGSVALAGIASSLMYLARLLVAYPVGWVIDARGRRAGLLLGLGLSLIGAIGVGLSMAWGSFPLFLAGLLTFGLGVGAGQQLRTAAADMYPPERRAEGLGYVLTGSLAGALGGPLLIAAAQRAAAGTGLDATALAWLLVPAILLPSMVLVLLVRPDPKEIAANLGRFYPGYRPPAAASLTGGAGIGAWFRHYPLLTGFVTLFAVNGIMATLMALVPLQLSHHGHALPVISLTVALHVVGMYGLSLPLGWLTDRVGRRSVILAGVILAAAGALLVPLTTYAAVATGLFLVGVGWSCANVAVTALLADAVPPAERGRAVGVGDSFAGAGSIVLPLAGGLLVQVAGFTPLALILVGLALVPFALALRLDEATAGIKRIAKAPAW
jgi:MFS family permease